MTLTVLRDDRVIDGRNASNVWAEVGDLANLDRWLPVHMAGALAGEAPSVGSVVFVSHRKGRDPAHVQEIVRIWRNVRQMGQNPTGSSTALIDNPYHRHSDRISSGRSDGSDHFAAESVSQRTWPNAGLGSASPWNQTDSRLAGGQADSAYAPRRAGIADSRGMQPHGHSAAWDVESTQNQRLGRNPVQLVRAAELQPKFNRDPGSAFRGALPDQPTVGARSWLNEAPPTASPHQSVSSADSTRFELGPRTVTPLPVNGSGVDRAAWPEHSTTATVAAYSSPDPVAAQTDGVAPLHQDPQVEHSAERRGSIFGWPARPETGASTGPLANSVAGSSWTDELQKLISAAESELAHLGPGTTEAQRQLYIQKHIDLRMLYMLADQQQNALRPIPVLDAADQEFWQQMFWSMASYFDTEKMPDSTERATETIDQLRAAIQRLQEKAGLQLRNVSFCQKITSFGDYERFQRDTFSPGQPVLVYAEIVNFKSEPTASGKYRTLLKSSVEIYKAGPQGELVDRETFRPTEDLCQNYRSDYFHSYKFDIPQRLSLGPHVLKLTIEDLLSHKVATYSLNFTVE